MIRIYDNSKTPSEKISAMWVINYKRTFTHIWLLCTACHIQFGYVKYPGGSNAWRDVQIYLHNCKASRCHLFLQVSGYKQQSTEEIDQIPTRWIWRGEDLYNISPSQSGLHLNVILFPQLFDRFEPGFNFGGLVSVSGGLVQDINTFLTKIN